MMSKTRRTKFFSLVMVLMLGIFTCGFTGEVSAKSITKKVYSKTFANGFTDLNQTQIVAAMGAGWNLGNQLEANSNGTPNETAWGNPVVTQNLIKAVKNAGFNTIRIPVSYLSKIGNGPNYTIDTAWLARVKQVVDYAYSLGMYVIINIHGDGYNSVNGSWLLCNSSDQATIKTKYQKVWQQIASTFSNYDQHLIFESMNEEFDGTYGTPNTTYYSNINAYNQIFVDTVRQTGGNNAARWLLIPGWNTNIDYTTGNYGFQLPTDNYRDAAIPSSEKRIMISVHYYAPWDFCGEESGAVTQWGTAATDSSKKSTWGQEDYMNSEIQATYNKFVTAGYPVIIGEYGSVNKTSIDASNNTYREAFTKTLCSDAKQYGCVPVIWDNGDNGQYGFGLFNRNTATVTQQGIIDAIMSGMNIQTTTNSTITPASSSFDKSNGTDIAVNMNLNGNTLSSITKGGSLLALGTDYTVSNNTVNILKSYLTKEQIGTASLTFNFSAGSAATLNINVIDSSDASGSIKVEEYNGSTSTISNTLNPQIELINTGTTSINLSNVKIRYYYTVDKEQPQNFTCDWSSVGASNVTGNFVKMPSQVTGADYYLEIGFSSAAGALAAGQSVSVETRIYKTDWSNFTQTNDYSFNQAATSFVDWNKATAYISGSLKWGVEPQ